MADDAAWTRAQLAHERGKARWAPYKGDPERQCTARCKRSTRRCKAPRLKRADGTLAPTCRMHGGELGSLESQARALERLVAFRLSQARGAHTKLALVREAIERERGIKGRLTSEKEVTSPVVYSGPIEESVELRALSGVSPESRQSSGPAELAEGVGSAGAPGGSVGYPPSPQRPSAVKRSPPYINRAGISFERGVCITPDMLNSIMRFAVGDGRPRGPAPLPISKRFWPKVAVVEADKCWLWLGKKDHNGYGTFRVGSRTNGHKRRLAHRVAWELTNGPAPEGRLILHTCDVRDCVNPNHLYVGTHQDNMRDVVARGRARGGRRSQLSAEQRDLIRARYSEGWSYRQIMDEVGVRRDVLRWAVRDLVEARAVSA